MTRYTIFMAAVLGLATAAVAVMAPSGSQPETATENVTIIKKNQAFPVALPLPADDCSSAGCGAAQS